MPKTVVITGAGSGFGRGAALELAKRGHKVIATTESEAQAKEFAHAHPELVTYSDNIRQLEALAREAILPGAAAEQLAETYRRYRQRLHRLSLAGLPGVVPDAEFAEERRFVTQQWAQVFG